MYDPTMKPKSDAKHYLKRCKAHRYDAVKHDEDGLLYMRLSNEARDELAALILADIESSSGKKYNKTKEVDVSEVHTNN